MSINEQSILSKTHAFIKSQRGQRRIKTVLKQAMQNGGVLPSGRKVIDEIDIALAVTEFLSLLRAYAADLPDSVYKPIVEAYDGTPVYTPRGCEVPIYFAGDMSRESLEDGEYGRTGEGVDNIVAVFNNGAHARATAYGWWTSESVRTPYSLKSAGGDSVWVPSKKDRAPMQFIQRAVNDFNSGWGKDNGVHISAADIAEIYQR